MKNCYREFYLERFKKWSDILKINNPLEYDNIVRDIYYNNSREVLWIDFKDPKFSISVVQRSDQLTCFEFYFAISHTTIKIKNCNLDRWEHAVATNLDIPLLKFLVGLGMLEFKYTLPNLSNEMINIKFTLKERILENGTV